MTQEALKLALEALEELFDTNGYWWQEVDEQTLKKIEHSITVIKEALREHAMREVQRLGQEIEQEPVAWEQFYLDIGKPQLTHPPQLEERNFCPRCGKRTKDIHTCTPPQD
jgi:hypothetical protein